MDWLLWLTVGPLFRFLVWVLVCVATCVAASTCAVASACAAISASYQFLEGVVFIVFFVFFFVGGVLFAGNDEIWIISVPGSARGHDEAVDFLDCWQVFAEDFNEFIAREVSEIVDGSHFGISKFCDHCRG